MPRTKRVDKGGHVYHVMNRATFNRSLFMANGDSTAFLKAMRDAVEQAPMRILAYCLMIDHWHLVLWPREEGDLSRFMYRLTLMHAQRWNAWHMCAGEGHLYQGRYRSFPVQPDWHTWAVCRYVEQNPVRDRRAGRPEEWRWSSAGYRAQASQRDPARADAPQPEAPSASGQTASPEWVELPLVDPAEAAPVATGAEARLDAPPAAEELEAIRECLRRSRPFGDPLWQVQVARSMGIESTLRSRGRPKKAT